MLRLRHTILPVAIATAALCAGASSASAASLALGEAVEPNSGCAAGPFTGFQQGTVSGGDTVVPAGTWRVTSWRTRARNGTIRLQVLRPTATPSTFTMVAETASQTLTSGFRSFPADIAVQPGDRLAFQWSSPQLAACALFTGNSADVIRTISRDVNVGDTRAVSQTASPYRLSLGVSLTSVPARACALKTVAYYGAIADRSFARAEYARERNEYRAQRAAFYASDPRTGFAALEQAWAELAAARNALDNEKQRVAAARLARRACLDAL